MGIHCCSKQRTQSDIEPNFGYQIQEISSVHLFKGWDWITSCTKALLIVAQSRFFVWLSWKKMSKCYYKSYRSYIISANKSEWDVWLLCQIWLINLISLASQVKSNFKNAWSSSIILDHNIEWGALLYVVVCDHVTCQQSFKTTDQLQKTSSNWFNNLEVLSKLHSREFLLCEPGSIVSFEG